MDGILDAKDRDDMSVLKIAYVSDVIINSISISCTDTRTRMFSKTNIKKSIIRFVYFNTYIGIPEQLVCSIMSVFFIMCGTSYIRLN